MQNKHKHRLGIITTSPEARGDINKVINILHYGHVYVNASMTLMFKSRSHES